MNNVTMSPEVSVIIPVGARRSDLRTLCEEYVRGLESLGRSFEAIIVIDGADDGVASEAAAVSAADPRFSVLTLAKTFGESTALMAGFEHTSGSVILTLPGYFQIDAGEIPKLVAALDQAEVVVCCRTPRAGGALERLRRAAFHGVVGSMTGLRLRDLGCSARAMQRSVLEEVSLYGDQHRLLPALADRQGFKVREIEVRQSDKDRYQGGYRTRDYAHRLLDVFAVFFLVRFTKKPLRFFGMVGATTFIIGALLLAYLSIDRLVFGHPLADRPALLLSSLLVVLGMQVFALGLLGELMIFTHARQLKDYQVDRVIQYRKAG